MQASDAREHRCVYTTSPRARVRRRGRRRVATTAPVVQPAARSRCHGAPETPAPAGAAERSQRCRRCEVAPDRSRGVRPGGATQSCLFCDRTQDPALRLTWPSCLFCAVGELFIFLLVI